MDTAERAVRCLWAQVEDGEWYVASIKFSSRNIAAVASAMHSTIKLEVPNPCGPNPNLPSAQADWEVADLIWARDTYDINVEAVSNLPQISSRVPVRNVVARIGGWQRLSR